MPVESPPEVPSSAGRQTPSPLRQVSKRVKLIERTAGWFIRAAAFGIILIVALIFVFIGLETLPLFRSARQEMISSRPLPGTPAPADVLALGIDEYHSNFY